MEKKQTRRLRSRLAELIQNCPDGLSILSPQLSSSEDDMSIRDRELKGEHMPWYESNSNPFQKTPQHKCLPDAYYVTKELCMIHSKIDLYNPDTISITLNECIQETKRVANTAITKLSNAKPDQHLSVVTPEMKIGLFSTALRTCLITARSEATPAGKFPISLSDCFDNMFSTYYWADVAFPNSRFFHSCRTDCTYRICDSKGEHELRWVLGSPEILAMCTGTWEYRAKETKMTSLDPTDQFLEEIRSTLREMDKNLRTAEEINDSAPDIVETIQSLDRKITKEKKEIYS